MTKKVYCKDCKHLVRILEHPLGLKCDVGKEEVVDTYYGTYKQRVKPWITNKDNNCKWFEKK